jgi:hypothetical protein
MPQRLPCLHDPHDDGIKDVLPLLRHLDIVFFLFLVRCLGALRDEWDSDITALEVNIDCEWLFLLQGFTLGLLVKELHLGVEKVDQTSLQGSISKLRRGL